MVRGWLLALAIPASVVVTAGPARAEDDPPGCPPGEWFCDDGEAPPAEGEAPTEAEPDASGADDDFAPRAEQDFDVRRPAPPRLREQPWSEGSGARASSPWALALRVQGVLLDGERQDTALGGGGSSLRFSPGPVVTFDLGVDAILGTDHGGNDRSELSLSLSTLLFLNYHPVVRSYVLVGLNTSRARVDLSGDVQTWGYFGGHAGLGLEFSLDPRLALSFDIVGFMRGRTDSRAAREPEFTDALGRVTNTSGGALMRGGVVIRF